MTKSTAIVLSGAVAKGSFEAGVLKSIISKDLNIKSIVATSSGGLNALALATGIVSGKAPEAIDDLVNFWLNKGSFFNIASPSLSNILTLKGFSSSKKLESFVSSFVEKYNFTATFPVKLTYVLTQLSGRINFIAGKPQTTFEREVSFTNNDFTSADKRKDIYTATAASACFPGLFAPVRVPAIGLCSDGGIVNDTALKWALTDNTIERVIVVSSTPAIATNTNKMTGLNLVSDIANILLNERLYRDLTEADKINNLIKRLNGLKDSRVLNDDQLKKVLAALNNKREIEIVQITPKTALSGSSFSGLFSKKLRQEYIDAGIKAGAEVKL